MQPAISTDDIVLAIDRLGKEDLIRVHRAALNKMYPYDSAEAVDVWAAVSGALRDNGFPCPREMTASYRTDLIRAAKGVADFVAQAGMLDIGRTGTVVLVRSAVAAFLRRRQEGIDAGADCTKPFPTRILRELSDPARVSALLDRDFPGYQSSGLLRHFVIQTARTQP